MSWRIKDEWIDLAQAKHTVVFHNPQVLVEGKPVEHHLVNFMKLDQCPTCGHARASGGQDAAEFAETKAAVLKQLQDHHRTLHAYTEKHRGVRIGSGPKA